MARIRPMVNSDKHEITWSNLGQDAGTAPITIVLSTAVQMASKNTTSEVVIGAKIKWVYFEFHFSPAQTGNANVIHWKVQAVPTNQTPSSPSVYGQTDRAYTLKRGMEMLPVNVSTVFKRIFVVKVPKIYQRQKQDFDLQFIYQASSTQTINACGFSVYKEFY